MAKKSFLLMIISFITLSACGLNNSADITEWEPTEYEAVNTIDGVSMNVKKGSLSSTGLTVTLENNSDKQCVYGEPYLLEKKYNGKWYQVPIAFDDNYGFDDIGYELPSSENSEWSVDWEWLYGKLDTGDYRIIKYILDFRKAGDYDEHHLAAEFTIE